MSRRNGESLAKALSKRIQRSSAESPKLSPSEHWGRALESRPGWQGMGGGAYRFRTGESVELKSGSSPRELLARITAIEVKPLASGMPPEVQRILEEEAVSAAVAWWEENHRIP